MQRETEIGARLRAGGADDDGARLQPLHTHKRSLRPNNTKKPGGEPLGGVKKKKKKVKKTADGDAEGNDGEQQQQQQRQQQQAPGVTQGKTYEQVRTSCCAFCVVGNVCWQHVQTQNTHTPPIQNQQTGV
jgi:hypothetical protein